MYQNVSDEAISAADSSSFIIAQLVAFGDSMTGFTTQAEKAQHVIDGVNEVANNFSVSSADLANNLGNMSAVMAQTGASFEESLGMLTAITEVTRNASKASRGLVSIGSRLNQVIDESSSTGKALKDIYEQLGIELFDQEGQLRSSYDIFTDLAAIWDTLDKNTQNYIASQQAGTNQFQTFAALMQNFSTASEATATALDSAGSAAKENERYMESLNAKTQQLKATFQDLANNVISNELVGAILDLADGFLKLANTDLGTFVTQMLLLTSVGWGATTLLQVSNLIPTVVSQFSNFATVIGAVSSGSASLTTALAGLTTGGTAIAGAFASALPVILGVSAAAAGIALVAPEVSDWWKELTGDTEYYTEKVQEANAELEQNKTKLEQLSAIPEPDRTSAIQSEIDKLKERNAELEKEIENWQQVVNQNNLEDVREQYGKYETSTYKIGDTGYIVEGAEDFNDAIEKGNALLDQYGEKLQDVNGNYLELKDVLVPVGEEWVESTENIQSLIDEFTELNDKVENNQSLTADEKSRYTELIDTLKNYSSDLQNCGVDVSDLKETEQDQIKIIDELTGEYDSNVSSLYNLASVANDGTTAIDGLDYSLALATAGIGLQKGQVDALSSAYPNLQSQIHETNGLYYLEQDALVDLAAAGDQWAINMISQQRNVTQAVYEELLKRKDAYLAEMKVLAAEGNTEGYLKNLQAFNELAPTLIKLRKSLEDPNNFNYSTPSPNFYVPTGGGERSGSSGSSSATDPLEEQNKLFEEQLAILEDRLKLLQESGAPIDEQIALLKEMQETVHDQAEWYRSQGVDENSEYLRELGQQWWEYYNEIIKLQKEALDNELDLLDDRAWFIEQNLADEEELNEQSLQDYINLQNQRVEIFQQAQEKIHALAEAYRAQGLKEDSEQLRELGKLWWEYENQITDINKTIADNQERVWEDAMRTQIDALQSQADVYEKLFSYISNQIDKEIDKLQEQRDKEEEYWDAKIQALEDQNDEIERQIQLEQLQQNLAAAKQQQMLVYKDGRFQYVQNVQAISEAETELEAFEREEALRQEVENLEKLKEQALASIDEQIAGWEEYKEQWSSVVDHYQEEQDRLLLEQELGIELEGELWKTRLDNLSSYVSEYESLMARLTQAQNALNAGFGSSSGGSSGGGSSGGGWGGSGGGSGSISIKEDYSPDIIHGGLSPNFEEDSEALKHAGEMWNQATSQEEKDYWHQVAEDIRNDYGYSGGAAGNKYIPLNSHAKGTLSSHGGLSLVGEEGPELRVLNQGDGIIPSNVTKNLIEMSKYSLKDLLASKAQNVYSYMFDKLVLPNVTDAQSFVNELKRFKQYAYQQ